MTYAACASWQTRLFEHGVLMTGLGQGYKCLKLRKSKTLGADMENKELPAIFFSIGKST